MKRQFILSLFFLLFGIAVSGQTDRTLIFHLDKSTIKEKIKGDSSSLQRAKEKAITSFQLDGYTGVYLKDSVNKGKSTTHYYMAAHHRFDKLFLNCLNARKNQTDREKSFLSLSQNLDDLIEDLENSGYPFAQIKIVDQKEENDQLVIEYVIDSADYYYIDKIHVKSEDKIHEKTLLNLLNIKVSDAYNEGKIRDIEDILNNSEFFQLKQPPQVLFRQGKAELYLFVEKKKSSNADGFIGFNQDKNTEKLVLNGNVNLALKNALNRAEVLDLNWKSNPDKTQNLRSIVRYPFIFNSPIGLGARINLRKQDTTFIKSDIWLELSYLHPKFTFSLFDQIEGSNTISNTPVSGLRDFKKNTIGLTFEYRPHMPEKLSFYHPRVSFLAGIFNYRSDTIDDNKQKIENNKYGASFGQTIDFLKYFHLNNRLSYQGLTSSITLSRNELIFYGGLNSVRGFYELELFGNEVWILNNELEFTPIKALSFKVLYDYSSSQHEGTNYTNSFGFGLGLINKNSRLEIVLANGILNDNPLDLSDSRIHIGFKSSF